MRVLKILMVSVTMTASLVVGVVGSANAAPDHSDSKVSPTGLWCC